MSAQFLISVNYLLNQFDRMTARRAGHRPGSNQSSFLETVHVPSVKNSLIKKFVFVLAFFGSCGAFAQTQWLTLVGDATVAAADTVQVEPVTFNRAGALRTVHLRVSRAAERKSWDGDAYRSYNAEVLIDCAVRTGRYLSIEFFAQPLWQGEPHGKKLYAKREIRPMLFRDIEPNPSQRLIRAACQTENVQAR
jgi:hypothetical protein